MGGGEFKCVSARGCGRSQAPREVGGMPWGGLPRPEERPQSSGPLAGRWHDPATW